MSEACFRKAHHVLLLTAFVMTGTMTACSRNETQDSIGATVETHAHDNAHSHDDHNDIEIGGSVSLSDQAMKNLGLDEHSLKPIELEDYQRTITIPAVVVSKPGRTQLQVSSPLNGVVTHVHAVTGEAVTPGQLLIELRLTHEDLVEAQTEFLKTVNELEVEDREIQRLDVASQTGAIPGRNIIERRYAKEKLEGLLMSQREALRLHGLTTQQITMIESEHRLLRDLAIVAPDIDTHSEDEVFRLSAQSQMGDTRMVSVVAPQDKPVLIVENLNVQKGQGVVAGEMLCTLSDYSQLYIQGNAFEQDAAAITAAAQANQNVTATIPQLQDDLQISGLSIAYLETQSMKPAVGCQFMLG